MHSLLGRSPGSPAWPALYNPTIELFNVAHHPAVAPGASYLTEARDVFRFTFFWSLIFYLPLFGVCGFLAFLNILLAPAPHSRGQGRGRSRRRSWSRGNSGRKRSLSDADAASMHELDALALRSPVPGTPGVGDALLLRPAPSNVSGAGASATLQQQEQQPTLTPTRTPPRVNPQRTRVVYALLVLLAYCAAGVLGAVIGAAVIGYVLAGLYEAGRFHLSTWMPPIFALVQALIGVLGVYPSVIEII